MVSGLGWMIYLYPPLAAMRKNISHCPFERYADDCVIHCQTERQAQWVRGQLEKRFTQCDLTLHPVKTKIVDCRTNTGSR